jgi:hypothetical protein
MQPKVGSFFVHPDQQASRSDFYVLAQIVDDRSKQVGYVALPVFIDRRSCFRKPAKLASEAVSGLLTAGFSAYKIHKIEVRAIVNNQGVIQTENGHW